MLSRCEESCGEVGLNSGFSGFFMVGDDMSGRWRKKTKKENRSKGKVPMIVTIPQDVKFVFPDLTHLLRERCAAAVLRQVINW